MNFIRRMPAFGKQAIRANAARRLLLELLRQSPQTTAVVAGSDPWPSVATMPSANWD
jgi:hypothetical protein